MYKLRKNQDLREPSLSGKTRFSTHLALSQSSKLAHFGHFTWTIVCMSSHANRFSSSVAMQCRVCSRSSMLSGIGLLSKTAACIIFHVYMQCVKWKSHFTFHRRWPSVTDDSEGMGVPRLSL